MSLCEQHRQQGSRDGDAPAVQRQVPRRMENRRNEHERDGAKMGVPIHLSVRCVHTR